jgi:hypothetical protein
MKKHHQVDQVKFRQGKLCLIVDGTSLECPLESISAALANASKQQRETFEISPGGYGIHWPLIDEDLSIDGLLRTYSALSTLQPRPVTKQA